MDSEKIVRRLQVPASALVLSAGKTKQLLDYFAGIDVGTGVDSSAQTVIQRSGDVIYVGSSIDDLQNKIAAGVDGFPVERFNIRHSPFVPPGFVVKVTPPSFDEMMQFWKPTEAMTRKWDIEVPAHLRRPIVFPPLNVQLNRVDLSPQYRVTAEMVNSSERQVLFVGTEYTVAIDFLKQHLPLRYPAGTLREVPRRQWMPGTVYALDLINYRRWYMRIYVESIFPAITIKRKKKNCNLRRKKK